MLHYSTCFNAKKSVYAIIFGEYLIACLVGGAIILLTGCKQISLERTIKFQNSELIGLLHS